MKRTRPRALRGKRGLHGSTDVDLTRQRPHAEGMSLPFERDESPDVPAAPDAEGPRAIIEQAARDLAHGLRDTDRRGIPSDVPAPPVTPGQTEVPEEGVDVARYGRRPRPERDGPDDGA